MGVICVSAYSFHQYAHTKLTMDFKKEVYYFDALYKLSHKSHSILYIPPINFITYVLLHQAHATMLETQRVEGRESPMIMTLLLRESILITR